MRNIAKIALGVVLSAGVSVVALTGSAQAAVFGIYGDATTQAQTLANGQGQTANVLATLSAGSLTGLDVLWVLNGDNGAQNAALVGNADVASFVSNGGVLLYHDRNVTDAATGLGLVGGAGIAFTRLEGATIDIQTAINPLITGPGGTITNATLDGGNWSSHGFATFGSLPVAALAYLNNGTAGEIVDFSFGFGSGNVYYSTIPFDFYVGGSNNFNNIYGPNVITQAVSLVDQVSGVPEPSTWAMMLIGFGAIGFAMRRQRKQAKVRFAN